MSKTPKIRPITIVMVGAVVITGLTVTAVNHWQHLPDHRQGAGVLGQETLASHYSVTISDMSVGVPNLATDTKRVTLKAAVSNLSAHVLQLAPGLQMQLHDSSNQLTYATAKYLAAGKVIGGPAPAGSVSVMQLDFDIPSNAQPTDFIFQPDLASKPIIIRL